MTDPMFAKYVGFVTPGQPSVSTDTTSDDASLTDNADAGMPPTYDTASYVREPDGILPMVIGTAVPFVVGMPVFLVFWFLVSWVDAVPESKAAAFPVWFGVQNIACFTLYGGACLAIGSGIRAAITKRTGLFCAVLGLCLVAFIALLIAYPHAGGVGSSR